MMTTLQERLRAYAVNRSATGEDARPIIQNLMIEAANHIDELIRSHETARYNFLTMQNAANKLRIRAEAAEKRIAELVEALRPFVIPRDGAHSGAQSDNSPVFAFDDQEITVGDFRRARKALGDQP